MLCAFPLLVCFQLLWECFEEFHLPLPFVVVVVVVVNDLRQYHRLVDNIIIGAQATAAAADDAGVCNFLIKTDKNRFITTYR